MFINFKTMRVVLVAILLTQSFAYTQEEIEAKGREVMEEYRKDRGHWIHISEPSFWDHMVDHLGPNGLCVAGFFISPGKYSSLHPGEQEQNADPLFSAFKEMAKDQAWLKEFSMDHKFWSFGYGHDKEVARQVGCEDIGEHTWDHACIIVAKTSADGRAVFSAHTTHFGYDHTKRPHPTPEDIRKFILEKAKRPFASGNAEL